MRPSDVKAGASLLSKGEGVCGSQPDASFFSSFSPPPLVRTSQRRTFQPGVEAVLMWAEGRWCTAAWGRRSVRSCWTVYSCNPPRTEAPGRPGPAARRRAGEGGRRLEEPGRRRDGVGKTPSSPPWTDTQVKTDFQWTVSYFGMEEISLA